MNTMPYTIENNSYTSMVNTGHPTRWVCRVDGCEHQGTAPLITGAELAAGRHSASHTDEELASTGYEVRFDWAAEAWHRLGGESA